MTDAELGNVLPLLEEWMPQERVCAVPRVCVCGDTCSPSLTHVLFSGSAAAVDSLNGFASDCYHQGAQEA